MTIRTKEARYRTLFPRNEKGQRKLTPLFAVDRTELLGLAGIVLPQASVSFSSRCSFGFQNVASGVDLLTRTVSSVRQPQSPPARARQAGEGRPPESRLSKNTFDASGDIVLPGDSGIHLAASSLVEAPPGYPR
jgi:hypothetical protein